MVSLYLNHEPKFLPLRKTIRKSISGNSSLIFLRIPFLKCTLASPKNGRDRVMYLAVGSGGAGCTSGWPGSAPGVSSWVWSRVPKGGSGGSGGGGSSGVGSPGRNFWILSECLDLNSLTAFSNRSRGNLFLMKMDLRYAISSKNEPIFEQILSALKRRQWIRPNLYLSWVKELCFIRSPV